MPCTHTHTHAPKPTKVEGMRCALEAVRAHCKKEGLRLTPQRAGVLEIVLGAAKPLTAYAVLEALQKTYPGAKPPTAYRALEFLQAHHFVHRIESLNAYTACAAGHWHSGSQFLVCTQCGSATEAHVCSVPSAFENLAAKANFSVTGWQAELHGVCAQCA